MEITPIIKDDFVVLDHEETISKMIGKLKMFEKRSGLVFKDKKYMGLVEKKQLLRSRIDVEEAKIKHYMQKTPLLSENADIIETAYLMFQSNLDYLPVERNKEIIGVVSALDLVKLSSVLPEVKHLDVSDIKLLKTTKINKEDPVSTAMTIMYQERVDQVPVFDQGKLYGIISHRDFLRKYLNWSPRRDISAKFNKMASSRSAEADMPHLACLPVSTFSTNDNILTTSLGCKLPAAIDLMIKNNVTNLLVMDKEDLVGLLTVKNILRRVGSLKIPKTYNIKFVGLNSTQLEPYHISNIQKIASNEAMKLQRKVHNENFALTIHLKEYNKEGKQRKYSVNMRVEFPGQIITATQDDWDVETALRMTFNNAKNKLKRKFKGDTSWEKYYG